MLPWWWALIFSVGGAVFGMLIMALVSANDDGHRKGDDPH